MPRPTSTATFFNLRVPIATMASNKAQRAKSEVELRVEEALNYLDQFPVAKVATVARQFDIPRSRLRRRQQGISSKFGRTSATTKLLNEEEVAICRYIDRLDKINFAVRVEFITDAANSILRERLGPEAPDSAITVGKHWATRFIQRHGYTRMLQKKVDSNRKASEDTERTISYFQQLEEVINTYGIPVADIWNMDETGFRIGIGKDQLIVTKRKREHLFSMPENRESATAMEAISADGRVVPAFLIVTGQVHMAQWYRVTELQPATKITTSASGYTNDSIALSWIKHFNQYATPISRYRLLILDGHGSHHTKEFISYCEGHKIIPFAMPPHLTHLLQPLDVVVFQPYKHYHAKALDILVRDGVINITKIEFLSIIQDIRIKTFKKKTILSALKKTGISPFNPQLVIQIMKEREAIRTPSPQPSWQASSDFETPITLRHMNKVADKIDEALYEEGLSDDELSYNLSRFIRGSLINAAELIQTKRDLGRTKKAKIMAQRRRAMKNRPLQSGGTLSVEEARKMVVQRDDEDLYKARKLVEAADRRDRNRFKKAFSEAAKTARKWRMDKVLDALEICDEKGVRYLRRG